MTARSTLSQLPVLLLWGALALLVYVVVLDSWVRSLFAGG